jgi:hypothetical protein
MNSLAPERLLILAKTYPTLSTKYGETVCTAAIREDGTWVRLYPVPFRRLGEQQQYKKFDWLECRIEKNTKDRRPESFRPVCNTELAAIAHLDTSNDWAKRRHIVLQQSKVYDRLEDLIIGAKNNTMSLATFRPTQILDFVYEEEDAREWDSVKLMAMRKQVEQLSLIEDNSWRETFRVIPKLPYKFSYRFSDASGRESKLQILDWEIGALYWNCLRGEQNKDEAKAIAKVKQKYYGDFLKKDLHFFLGTTLQFHSIAPNPWLVIGVFPIPYQGQLQLL